LRWEDGVDQDIRVLEVSNWKKVANNRDEWAKLLKKARAHQRLRANDEILKSTFLFLPVFATGTSPSRIGVRLHHYTYCSSTFTYDNFEIADR
jgi:hypothetical protein